MKIFGTVWAPLTAITAAVVGVILILLVFYLEKLPEGQFISELVHFNAFNMNFSARLPFLIAQT
ncbi:hypothetical protein [uncultured Tolumonas sp.]|uniref:hypothetical protein n=1 Tax=uncultured Tolumonas sp. TaxID=263765 RepID=UPI00292CDF91|nr:hypothetical protein [uncultured Tolumonas sp.]